MEITDRQSSRYEYSSTTRRVVNYSRIFFYSSTRLFLFPTGNFISGCSFCSHFTNCWNLCKVRDLAISFATASLEPVHSETVPSRSRHHIDAIVAMSVFLLTSEDEDCQLHGFTSRLTQI